MINLEERDYFELPDGSILDAEMTKKEDLLNKRQIKYSTKYEPDVLDNLEKSVLKIVEREDDKFVFICWSYRKGDYLYKHDFQFEDKKKDFSLLYLRDDNGRNPVVIGNLDMLPKSLFPANIIQ